MNWCCFILSFVRLSSFLSSVWSLWISSLMAALGGGDVGSLKEVSVFTSGSVNNRGWGGDDCGERWAVCPEIVVETTPTRLLTKAVIEACSRNISSCLSSSFLILSSATFNSCVSGHDSLSCRSSPVFSSRESHSLQVLLKFNELRRLLGETADWTENLSVITLLSSSSLSLHSPFSNGRRWFQGFKLKFKTWSSISLLRGIFHNSLRGVQILLWYILTIL